MQLSCRKTLNRTEVIGFGDRSSATKLSSCDRQASPQCARDDKPAWRRVGGWPPFETTVSAWYNADKNRKRDVSALPTELQYDCHAAFLTEVTRKDVCTDRTRTCGLSITSRSTRILQCCVTERGWDSDPWPSGYEPDDLPTDLPRSIAGLSRLSAIAKALIIPSL